LEFPSQLYCVMTALFALLPPLVRHLLEVWFSNPSLLVYSQFWFEDPSQLYCVMTALFALLPPLVRHLPEVSLYIGANSGCAEAATGTGVAPFSLAVARCSRAPAAAVEAVAVPVAALADPANTTAGVSSDAAAMAAIKIRLTRIAFPDRLRSSADGRLGDLSLCGIAPFISIPVGADRSVLVVEAACRTEAGLQGAPGADAVVACATGLVASTPAIPFLA
jgi:hypothetical protein